MFAYRRRKLCGLRTRSCGVLDRISLATLENVRRRLGGHLHACINNRGGSRRVIQRARACSVVAGSHVSRFLFRLRFLKKQNKKKNKPVGTECRRPQGMCAEILTKKRPNKTRQPRRPSRPGLIFFCPVVLFLCIFVTFSHFLSPSCLRNV